VSIVADIRGGSGPLYYVALAIIVVIITGWLRRRP
jgi:hypothetical protein